jgi:methyltransferase
VLVAQRLWELRRSARNTRRMMARGGVEHGRGHFPLFNAIHTLFPLGLIAEVAWGGARPGPAWPLWLGLYAGAGLLRAAVIRALGDYWNVRVWVVPGMTPVRNGPYRLMPHPNYVAVVIELVSGAMLFGAWRTALAVTPLYLAALAVRIPVEERARASAAGGSAG